MGQLNAVLAVLSMAARVVVAQTWVHRHGCTHAGQSTAPGGHSVAAVLLLAAAARINSAEGHGSLKLWVLMVGNKQHRNMAYSLLHGEGHAE